VEHLWTTPSPTPTALSHNCGRLVDNGPDDSSDCTLTGTDGIHRLWI
jgi:hypothetical protein